MRAARQTYAGRVIYPAKYIESKKPFLSFVLYVDNHLVVNNNERKSARISCNYTLPDNFEKDPVAVVLSRIFSKEEPDTGGLAGTQYKSVDVLVEGDERLVEVEGKPGAVYKNLDYARVTIVDKHVLSLFRQEFNSNNSTESTEQETSSDSKVERPSTAPTAKASTKAATTKTTSTQKTTTTKKEPSYQVGDIVEHGGKQYKYVGGAVNAANSWQEVEEESEVEDDRPPFMQEASPTTKTSGKPRSSLRNVIEGEESDMEFNQTESPV